MQTTGASSVRDVSGRLPLQPFDNRILPGNFVHVSDRLNFYLLDNRVFAESGEW